MCTRVYAKVRSCMFLCMCKCLRTSAFVGIWLADADAKLMARHLGAAGQARAVDHRSGHADRRPSSSHLVRIANIGNDHTHDLGRFKIYISLY